MTVQYAIVAFPTFDTPDQIEAVRRAFDPQASLLPAHVTLVFPFSASQRAAELETHIRSALAGASPFDVTLAPPSPELGGYLFLRVESGRQRVIELHDALYSGPLRAHLSPTHPYEPHVTIGHIPSVDAISTALLTARESIRVPVRARIDSISLFLMEDGAGRVELTVPLDASGDTRSR